MKLGQEHLAELTRIAPRRLDFQLTEELDLFIDIIEFLLLIPLLRGQSQCSSHDSVLFDF